MIGDERYIHIPQRLAKPDGTSEANPEWLAMRVGCLTSSKIRHAITKPAELLKKDGTPRKVQELQARIDLKEALVFERTENLTMPGYLSKDMQRGIELEDTAIMAYEYAMGVTVQRIGFVMHPTIPMCGASWDGYIPELKRILEVKVPAPHTHWRYLLSGEIPDEYVDQVRWGQSCEPEMIATDFMSYCPQMRPEHQVFIVRMMRDNERIAAMESEALKFLAEVEALKAEKDLQLAEYGESLKGLR